MKFLSTIVSLLFAPALAAAPGIELCSCNCPHQPAENDRQRVTGLFDQHAASEVQQRSRQ